MVLHRLTPAVQHGDAADLGAEVARVGGDEAERLGGGAEQDGVDRRLVLEGDRPDRGRQGEDDVEVGDGQQLGAPRRHPGRPRRALALRAVPVAAGVVGDRGVAAVGAAPDMPAEYRGAAGLDRAHHPALVAVEVLAARWRGTRGRGGGRHPPPRGRQPWVASKFFRTFVQATASVCMTSVEARIRDHLGEMVRGTVEETLNAMLDAEADQLCGAGRYERSQARQDTRAGSYERTLQTSAGGVNLKVPKLRRQTFETAIIERYRRRESSVEEALIEMYLAGISVRRVEDITEALWGTRVSPSTVSNLNKKIYVKIEAWRNRRIEGEHPYLYLDGIVMKRTWAGEVRNVSLLVASAVNSEGYREILGICEGAKEDKSGWSAFLRHLVDRGLTGVRLIISDACRGLMESAAEYLPEARWQRCMVGSLKKLATKRFSDHGILVSLGAQFRAAS